MGGLKKPITITKTIDRQEEEVPCRHVSRQTGGQTEEYGELCSNPLPDDELPDPVD